MNAPDATQAAQSTGPMSGDQSGTTTPVTGSDVRCNASNCEHCGSEFVPAKEGHRFCSDRCRYADYDKRNPRINKVPKRKRRTNQQNRALHKFFKQLADALNESGYSVAKTLRHDVDIPWNGATVKELLWRPVQEAMTGKHSTTEMNTVDPSEIYEVLNRHLGEKLGVHVEWPSEETMSGTANSGQVSSSLPHT